MNGRAWTYAVIASASLGWSCAAVIGIEDGHARAVAGGMGGLSHHAGEAGAAAAGRAGSSGSAAAGDGGGGGGGAAGIGGSGGGAGSTIGGSGGGTAGGGGGAMAGQGGTAGLGGSATGGVGYGVPPTGVQVRLLASTGDDPVAALATDGASSLVVTGRLGGPMPIGAPGDLLPAPLGQTSYVLRYTQADQLVFAARLRAPQLVTRRLITGADGSIYVLGEADGAVEVLDVASTDPQASPTAAVRGPIVLRFDASGLLVWAFRLGAAPGQRLDLDTLALSADGSGVLIAGSFDGSVDVGSIPVGSTNATSVDVLVVRLAAATGIVEHVRVIGTSGPDENPRLVTAPGGSRLAFTCGGAIVTPVASGLPDCQGIVTVGLDETLALGAASTFDVSGPDELVLARGRDSGFLVGARYAGTAALPPLPPLPSGPGRFLVAALDDAGVPVRARTLPEPGLLSLAIITADLDGGVLVGGSGRGCIPGDAGGQVCSSPANAKNGVVVRLDPQLGLEWAVFQGASSGAPQGIVKGIVLCPNGELLGASSFDASVAVLKQKVPWKGGTDAVVGRFFH